MRRYAWSTWAFLIQLTFVFSASSHRSPLLGVAFPSVAGVAQRPGVCPAPYCHHVAAPAVSHSLATVEPAGDPWPTCHGQGGARPHLCHVAGVSHGGIAPDGRRTPEARHEGSRDMETWVMSRVTELGDVSLSRWRRRVPQPGTRARGHASAGTPPDTPPPGPGW